MNVKKNLLVINAYHILKNKDLSLLNYFHYFNFLWREEKKMEKECAGW